MTMTTQSQKELAIEKLGAAYLSTQQPELRINPMRIAANSAISHAMTEEPITHWRELSAMQRDRSQPDNEIFMTDALLGLKQQGYNVSFEMLPRLKQSSGNDALLQDVALLHRCNTSDAMKHTITHIRPPFSSLLMVKSHELAERIGVHHRSPQERDDFVRAANAELNIRGMQR